MALTAPGLTFVCCGVATSHDGDGSDTYIFQGENASDPQPGLGADHVNEGAWGTDSHADTLDFTNLKCQNGVAGIVLNIGITSQQTVSSSQLQLTLTSDTGIENVNGTDKAERSSDTITGNSNANVIRGYRGNDTLKGEGGGDTLEGGFGADELHGGAGRDLLKGQEDEDRFKAQDGETDTLDGGSGNDTALLATDRDAADSTNSVENL